MGTMASGMLHPGFQGDLIVLVRKHGLGDMANTPDHTVAGILTERYEQLRLAHRTGHEPGPTCTPDCHPGLAELEHITTAGGVRVDVPTGAHNDGLPCTDECFNPGHDH